jgi:iron complex outermembrane receptor protein
MGHRRSLWIGSSSVAALLAASSAVYAQSAPADDAKTLKEVVVTGIRASLQKAIQIKRNSDDLVDAISAEDIGKLPDRNVADALQRIPGVNTVSAASGEGGFDENDRVSIRGTPPSFVSVMIDGHPVSTGDWFVEDQYQTVGRSVSMTLLPSEIVNTIVVDKSQNASLVEGGISGSINIETRNPLDLHQQYTVQAAVEGAYNSLVGSTKGQFNGLIGWKSSDGTLGVIVQGFDENRDVRRYGQEVLGYAPVTAPTGCTGGGTLSLTGNAYGCSAGALTGGTPISYTNASLVQKGVIYPTLIGSALFEQTRKRQGGDFAAQWRPTNTLEFKFTAFYSDLNASNVNDNYMFDGSREFTNGAPTSYTVSGGAISSASFPSNPTGNNIAAVVDNIIRPNAEARSEYFNLDGKYKVNDKLIFTGQVGYTMGLGHTPEQPSFEVDNSVTPASYAPSGAGVAVSFPGLNVQSPAGLANDWAWNFADTSKDKEFYGKIDGDYDLEVGFVRKVDFGVRYSDHDRKVDAWDRGCSVGGATAQCWNAPATPFSQTNPTSYPGGYSGSALGIPGLIVPLAGDPGTIINLINGEASGVRGSVQHLTNPQNDTGGCTATYQGVTQSCAGANYYFPYASHVHEKDWAAYVMAKLGGEGWRGNVGVRFVGTDQHSYVDTPDSGGGTEVDANCGCDGSLPQDILSSAFGPYYINNIHHTYFDVLPSLNLTFDLKPDLLFRVSAAETMTRPDYSALGGAVSLTQTNYTGNGGNPNLKPIKSANLDASLEWYYAPLASLTLNAFYMDVQNYVGYGNYVASYYTLQTHAYENYTISAPVNSSGQVQGFELAWQQPIAHTGFGFLGNYSFADSEASGGGTLVGDSRHTFNLTGYYENKIVSARLAYTYRSHFYVGLNEASPENQADTGSLDASVNIKLNKYTNFSIQGLNLTDELLKYYAANPSQIRAVYENGRQVYFGLHVKY